MNKSFSFVALIFLCSVFFVSCGAMTFHGLFNYDEPEKFDSWYASIDKEAFKNQSTLGLRDYYEVTLDNLIQHIPKKYPKGTARYEEVRKIYFQRAQQMINDGAYPLASHLVGVGRYDNSLVYAMYHEDDEAVLFLLKNGANPNNIKIRKWPSEKDIGGPTALHVAAGYNWYLREINYWRGSKKYYNLLLSYGANDQVKGKYGLTPRDIYVANFIADTRPEVQDNGVDFTQMFALAAGAMLATNSSMSSNQKADFYAAYSKDVMSNSNGENMAKWNQSANASLNQANSSSGGGGAAAQEKEESFTFTCPMGRSPNTVKIPYYTASCLTAAKTFTKAFACNLVDEMQSAQASCQSSCGNPSCLEVPK